MADFSNIGTGVYWVGQDGNTYMKASGLTGVQKWVAPLLPPDQLGLTQIADPMAPSGPASGGAAGGGTSAADAAAMADEQAYWGDQIGTIDSQLGRLPGQRQVADQNILNSYNSAYNRLVNEKGQTERNYNTSRTQTQQDNETAKTNIDTGVRNSLTGAQRLLGGRGSGSSSAFSIVAPYAAGLQGNQQRQQVQQAYERNIGGLDTSWKDYLTNWDTSAGDLASQRDSKYNQAHAGFDQTEAGLQEQRQNADVARAQAGGASYRTASALRAPYQAKIQQLLSSIDQLGAVPTFTPQQVNYNAPELAAYNYQPTATPTLGAGVDPGQAQNLGAFWTLLGGDPTKKRDQLQPALAQ